MNAEARPRFSTRSLMEATSTWKAVSIAERPHISTVNAIVRVLQAQRRYETVLVQVGGIETSQVLRARQAIEVAEQAREKTPEYIAQRAVEEAIDAAIASGNKAEEERQQNIAHRVRQTQLNATIIATKIFDFQKVNEKMRGTGFVVGGINESSVIRRLTQINGIPIAELERTMRDVSGEVTEEDIEDHNESMALIPPSTFGARALDHYTWIFLGPQESLINLLVEDNETVLGLGLTHQQLASFLDNFFMILSPLPDAQKYLQGQHQGTPIGTVTIGNLEYYVEANGSPGSVGSPFQDGISGDRDYFITRLDDDSRIQFGSMLPELIRSYGFYEGRETAYRLDPRKLAEFAGLISKESQS